jgi:2-phosphosulfolactate phosphatase
MARPLHVHLLPELVDPAKLAGGLVVVIDVLRATTTITCALAAGAARVIPCLEVDEARRVAAGLPPEETILGGERQGLKIEGFHLGNSPREYTPESVGGKTLVFSTTNGTKAMQHCRQAERVLLGSFLNFLAVGREISASRQSVHLLCAGTGGEITREDAALAGSLVYLLHYAAPAELQLNDEAAITLEVGRALMAEALASQNQTLAVNNVRHVLANSQGGRNLAELGLAADIDDASQIDLLDVVPQLELKPWSIHR